MKVLSWDKCLKKYDCLIFVRACLKIKFIFNIKELRPLSLKVLIKINSLISYLQLD